MAVKCKKFNSKFCRLFKSLEFNSDDLMGLVRIGKNNKIYSISENMNIYRKPCRILCSDEKKMARKYWDGIACGCESPFCWKCSFDKYMDYLIYAHKTEFQSEMINIKKILGLESNVHKWITISPKKGSEKCMIPTVLNQLADVTDEYFTGDIPRTNRVMRCLELGEDGDHPHIHILAEPISEHALKNFVRDYSKLWNRHGNKDLIANKKVAFNIQTIRRPEYIRARVEYLNNETKGITHHNPHDDLIESKYGVEKYKYF